jgi:ABC-type phosphate transport system substrate-binding protein
LIFVSTLLFSEEIYIIANRNFPVDKLTKKDIRSIYLDKKRHIKDKRILPLNYTYSSPLRELFERSVLKKSKKSLERYWIKAHYKGHRPPKVVKSKKSILSYIKKLDNAIGYIDSNLSKSKDIKLLLKVSP